MMFELLLVVLIPIIGILLTQLTGKRHEHRVAIFASLASLIVVLYSIYIYLTGGSSSLKFDFMYIPQLNLSFGFQLTQYSVVLLLMTSLVFLAASIVGNYFIKDKSRLYVTIFLLAESASFGVFLATNLIVFYIFWEVAEVMMFFMIFIFGGYNRRYAAIKFIMYSIASSLLLLIGIMLMYSYSTAHTFLIEPGSIIYATIPQNVQLMIVILLFLSFMIKMPVFPLHTWLPIAHTEAPTTGSMILAGVLLKFGSYGFLLLVTMIPLAHAYSTDMAALLIFSSLYSALVMLKQTNMKKLIAYTSIVDMGIIGIGIISLNVFGINGAVYGMLSHAIGISTLFLVAGVVDELYGTYELERIKGVVKNFSSLAYLFLVGAFVTIGLPLTSGFIADVLIFIGSYNAFGLVGLLPLIGIFLIGAMLFWVAERCFFRISKAIEPFHPFDDSVIITGTFLLISTIMLGIVPLILINFI